MIPLGANSRIIFNQGKDGNPERKRLEIELFQFIFFYSWATRFREAKLKEEWWSLGNGGRGLLIPCDPASKLELLIISILLKLRSLSLDCYAEGSLSSLKPACACCEKGRNWLVFRKYVALGHIIFIQLKHFSPVESTALFFSQNLLVRRWPSPEGKTKFRLCNLSILVNRGM